MEARTDIDQIDPVWLAHQHGLDEDVLRGLQPDVLAKVSEMAERGPAVDDQATEPMGCGPITRIEDGKAYYSGRWILVEDLALMDHGLFGVVWCPKGELHYEDDDMEVQRVETAEAWRREVAEFTEAGPQEEQFVVSANDDRSGISYGYFVKEVVADEGILVLEDRNGSSMKYMVSVDELVAGDVSKPNVWGSHVGWIVNPGVSIDHISDRSVVKTKDLPEDDVRTERLEFIRDELGIELKIESGTGEYSDITTDTSYVGHDRLGKAVWYLKSGEMTACLSDAWLKVFAEKAGYGALWLLEDRIGCSVSYGHASAGFQVSASVSQEVLDQALSEIDPNDCIPARPDGVPESSVFVLGGVPDYVVPLIGEQHEGVESEVVKGGVWIWITDSEKQVVSDALTEGFGLDERKFA